MTRHWNSDISVYYMIGNTSYKVKDLNTEQWVNKNNFAILIHINLFLMEMGNTLFEKCDK